MYNTVLVELWFIIQSQKREHGPQATQQHQQHQQMCRGVSLDFGIASNIQYPFLQPLPISALSHGEPRPTCIETSPTGLCLTLST